MVETFTRSDVSSCRLGFSFFLGGGGVVGKADIFLEA